MADSLRDLADERGVEIGAAVAADPLRETEYRRTLRREFNALTTENALKMGPLRPSRAGFDFEDADRIVGFAREHGHAVRGHALVWHRMLPDWLAPAERSGGELRRILRRHVRTVAARYAGEIGCWDVVNEAIADDGSMRETPWLRAFGPDYVDRAFEWVREVAPGADLFYNDYGAEGLGEKSEAVYDLLAGMLDRGVPVDGVGLQMHALRDHPDPEEVGANVARLRDLGLEVHVTEMDVAYPREDAPEDRREAQAEYYRRIVEACLEAGCETVVVWGVDDGHSWVQGFDDDLTDDPLLFDSNYAPKPAYHAVKEAIRGVAGSERGDPGSGGL